MRIIIIGTGLAGQLVLRELSKNGYSGEVLMLTKHRGDFYSKPSLSNVHTQGKMPEDLVLMEKSGIEVEFGCKIQPICEVVRIDVDAHKVYTESEEYEYDKLVLAQGSEPIEQEWLPKDDKIFRVNHLEEYELFHQFMENKPEVAIIGGGLIGVEFSHDIAPYSKKLYLVEAAPSLMAAQLPMEIGHGLQKQLESMGVDVLVGQKIKSIQVSDRVELCLNDRTINTDIALAAIGLRPQVELAKRAGLDVEIGISVNKYCQTSHPDVYALGDCAQVCGLLRYYVAPLKVCAQAVAKNLLGDLEEVHYHPMPVMLKTPSYPVCFCYKDMPRDWQISEHQDGIEARAYEGDKLVGFALSGSQMAKRVELKKLMDDWL